MKGRSSVAASFFWLAMVIFSLAPLPSFAAGRDAETIGRGAYLFAVAGCTGCHTDVKGKGRKLAGGRALKTPFGTFYGPNITPDPDHGIGKWSDADFIRALREGIAPDGSHYFPVFPYTSFSGMTDSDLLALKAYIFTLAPVARPNLPHAVAFPFGWQLLQFFWKILYFEPGPHRPDPARPPEWNRGAYLVRAVSHCGECHTARGRLGGLRHNMALAGTEDGPEGEAVPNITPDRATGIGEWSAEEIADFLETGQLPDGDFVGSLMAEVIDGGLDRLTARDRAAVVAYLRALGPVSNQIGRSGKNN